MASLKLTDSDHEDALDTNSSMRSASGSREKEKERESKEGKDTKERIRDLRRFREDRTKPGQPAKLKFHRRSLSQPRVSHHRRMLTSSALDARIVKHSLGSMAFLGSSIVYPEAWKSCFVALRSPDMDQMLVNESLKNITALVIGGWKNTCSLVQFEDVWSAWIVPLCLPPVVSPAKHDDDFVRAVRSENQSLAVKLLVHIAQQCFHQTTKFFDILRGILRNFAHFGIQNDCAECSLLIANTLLDTLLKRLTSTLPHVNLAHGNVFVIWGNFVSCLGIVREFALNSGLWTSSKVNKNLRMMATFDKNISRTGKQTRKFFSRDMSTTTSIVDESFGLHLASGSTGLAGKEIKCLDAGLVDSVINLLQTTISAVDSAEHGTVPQEIDRDSILEEELAFFEGLQVFIQHTMSNPMVSSANISFAKKLLASKGSTKLNVAFKSEVSTFNPAGKGPRKSVEPVEHKIDPEDLQSIRDVLLREVEIKEHKYMFQSFASCATGAEIIKGLLSSRIAKDSHEAKKIANSLWEAGYLVCVSHPDSPFSNNDNMLFKFPDFPLYSPNSPSSDSESSNQGRYRALSAAQLNAGGRYGSSKLLKKAVKNNASKMYRTTSGSALEVPEDDEAQRKRRSLKGHNSAENDPHDD
eukprot:TRINITY_DN4258_c0_g1_i2.p1 TRINITY_DN4258_c0_g1~~TRINITY_DN4258_c0_g1_i2.p1  ORF type:complete len:639 (+),score=138.93 TRINITY_DN4258_c0_g1_i2:55-1971(+)